MVSAPHSFSELDGMVRPGLPESALQLSVAHVGRTAEERKFAAADALARKQPISDEMKRLLQPGSSAGGARPKAVIRHHGEEWIAKFRSLDDEVDCCAIEHASLRLASACGIRVAHSELVKVNGINAVLVQRFDRVHGGRLHFASARSLLIAAGVPEHEMGYPDIADIIRSQKSRR